MAKALFVREFEYTRFNFPDEDFFLFRLFSWLFSLYSNLVILIKMTNCVLQKYIAFRNIFNFSIRIILTFCGRYISIAVYQITRYWCLSLSCHKMFAIGQGQRCKYYISNCGTKSQYSPSSHPLSDIIRILLVLHLFAETYIYLHLLSFPNIEISPNVSF